jgi:hypothetical protein
VKLLQVNSSVLNHQLFLFAPKGSFKAMISWKLTQNATKWAMFPLWLMGRCRNILGQNHTILLKICQILEKMYNQFIFTSIFTPGEYSYQKCHTCRLLFLMSQTRFVYFIGHFGKTSGCTTRPLHCLVWGWKIGPCKLNWAL